MKDCCIIVMEHLEGAVDLEELCPILTTREAPWDELVEVMWKSLHALQAINNMVGVCLQQRLALLTASKPRLSTMHTET
jgi:hypothetical protein